MSTAQIEASASATAVSKTSVVVIYINAVARSIGWIFIPYLVSDEVFSVRIRSINVSMLIEFHWAVYFGCSRAMPSLLASTDRCGAFPIFASICCASLGYVFFALLERAGRSLESLATLFQRSWYTVRRVAFPTADDLAHGGASSTEGKFGDVLDAEENGEARIEHVRVDGFENTRLIRSLEDNLSFTHRSIA